MASDPATREQMRRDWNDRAREDANYYVAFGRRGQDDEEFFGTASDVMRSMEAELKRVPAGAQRTALEIGCGPGRLMRPASRHFTEIHGVDVSDEMIRLAELKLCAIPHAHAHHTNGADLSMFADNYFDFVYSYAVFQHIPTREVVFAYLEEARRVLKPGGILWCQVNGLPPQATIYNTWNGVRISAYEMARFAREHDLQLLKLEGIFTQYMWVTYRKQVRGWTDWLQDTNWKREARILNISNAQTGEPVAPAAGPFAAASLWIEKMPPDCDLNHLEVQVDGRKAWPSYIGAPQWDGICQVNLALPDGTRTGLVPVDVFWLEKPLCPRSWMRIVRPGPLVPRVCSVSDGIHLLSGTRIVTGSVKVTLEQVAQPELFRAAVDGKPVLETDPFCTDPLNHRYEINFRLPEGVAPGPHQIDMRLGKRGFAPVGIEVG
jgi:SAM-dependent methyltransferase